VILKSLPLYENDDEREVTLSSGIFANKLSNSSG